MNRLCATAFLLFLFVAPAWSQYSKVSFYLSAHPDDWQLFMGVNAFKDIVEATSANSNKKVVFIYTTAGEANCDGHHLDPTFHIARQTGANRSVQFCADIKSPHSEWHSSIAEIKGIGVHRILRMEYKNVVSYFLRLPDGCFEQKPATLKKLAENTISSLSSIDSTTTYTGYHDLILTIKSIFNTEREHDDKTPAWINASDWDGNINPGDHDDHVQTGLLATRAAEKLPRSVVVLFRGYCTGALPPNLPPAEVAMEAALLSQLSSGLSHNGHNYEWFPGDIQWTCRNYFRTFKTYQHGVCDPAELNAVATPEKDNLIIADLPGNDPGIFPNPAGNEITVAYTVGKKGMVSITCFDISGKQFPLVINESEDTGQHSRVFDITAIPAGCYALHINTPEHSATLKFEKK